MRVLGRIGIPLILAAAWVTPSNGQQSDLRDWLAPENVVEVRVQLDPAGARLGFQADFDGRDPRLASLMTLIREAERGGGHKCANAGSIRFRMTDGRVIAVGLLPAHTPGVYGLRLYDNGRHLTTLRVDRRRLLAVLGEMGIPLDDPAFREEHPVVSR